MLVMTQANDGKARNGLMYDNCLVVELSDFKVQSPREDLFVNLYSVSGKL